MFKFTRLHGRWLYVIISLTCVMVAIITSSCGTPHKAYNYGNFTKQLSATAMHSGDEFFTFHPGDQFTLKWTPNAAQDTTSSSPVTISAELRGPFATLDALHAAQGGAHGDVNGPVVATMKPIQTDNWTDKTYQYDFLLKQNLAVGYYVLIQTVATGQDSSAFHSEIRVVA